MKIGIDIGGSHISVGIVTEEGKILLKRERNISFVDMEENEIKQEIRDTMLSLINVVLKEIEIPIFLIDSIGIGIPGIVENNIIKKCSKFKITDWNIAKELEEHYQITVKIQNDSYCAAIAEREYGNLKETTRAVFICLGTGIGGATILENQIISSEYGHMIIEKNGRECNCGKKGCFETYCSMKVLKNEIIKLLELDDNITSEELVKILIQNKQDERLDNYINEFVNTFIIGISNIINILNPSEICIGGGFTYFKEILFQRILEKNCLSTYQFSKPNIVLASLGNDAGIIGATLI